MKVLIALIDVPATGDPKKYCRPKVHEMLSAIMRAPGYTLHVEDSLEGLDGQKQLWCDEILKVARERCRKIFLDGSWDVLLYQSMDCLYASIADFHCYVAGAATSPYGIVGPLTVGRMQPDYVICRDFVCDYDGRYLPELEEIPGVASNGLRYHPCGYPSSDNMLIKRRVLEDVAHDDPAYQMWFERNPAVQNLNVDEWFCRSALNHGHSIACDTKIRTFHADDRNGLAHRYPLESKPLEDLRWS